MSIVQLLDSDGEVIADDEEDFKSVSTIPPPKSSEEVESTTQVSNTASSTNSMGENEVEKTGGTQQEALSYVCNDCGKKLMDANAVSFHAMKTKHENFSESSEAVLPLTEEEKAKRAEALREKLKEVRAKKEEMERKEQIEKEKRRRLEGKSMLEMAEKHKQLEIKKLAESRMREKREEEEARRRVLEQIRMDREAKRAEKNAQMASEVRPQQSVVQPPSSNVVDKGTCAIQVRLSNGVQVKEVFKSDESLAAVNVWVQLKRDELDPAPEHNFPFTLMSPFPRRVFTTEDYEKSLKILGLTPSANLVVTRRHE